MTVQNALRELREEGLIVSRQGSGVFVRDRTERPVGLRPHLERAFEQPRISVDFAGFSGETLHGVIQEPLDKIRIGRLTPESIMVRLLLSDTTQPMAVPCRTDGTDSPEFRARATEIQRRHTTAIIDSVEELGRLGMVPEVTAEVRVHRATPLFMLYLINNEEAFFGFYPVREHVLSLGGPEPEPIYDLMGKDAILFHHSTTDDDTSTGSQYVNQARTWFDSMWTTIGTNYIR